MEKMNEQLLDLTNLNKRVYNLYGEICDTIVSLLSRLPHQAVCLDSHGKFDEAWAHLYDGDDMVNLCERQIKGLYLEKSSCPEVSVRNYYLYIVIDEIDKEYTLADILSKEVQDNEDVTFFYGDDRIVLAETFSNLCYHIGEYIKDKAYTHLENE